TSSRSPEPVADGPVAPSNCGCGGSQGNVCTCGARTVQIVTAYAIGEIGYDFSTEARRDSFLQAMNAGFIDTQALVTYLKQNPYEASRITWTLMMESIPIYAIRAFGPYAETANERLVEFLEQRLHGQADLCSVAGHVSGNATLMSGQT